LSLKTAEDLVLARAKAGVGGRPWFPSRISSEGKDRSLRGRVMVLLEDASGEECKLGGPISLLIILAICISCVSLCLETIPTYLHYEPACDACRPLSFADTKDPSKVTARAALASACEECAPGEYPTFLALEFVCIMLFSAEYVLRLACCSAVELGSDEFGSSIESKWSRCTRHNTWAIRTW
jgi:hypothetical protein